MKGLLGLFKKTEHNIEVLLNTSFKLDAQGIFATIMTPRSESYMTLVNATAFKDPYIIATPDIQFQAGLHGSRR